MKIFNKQRIHFYPTILYVGSRTMGARYSWHSTNPKRTNSSHTNSSEIPLFLTFTHSLTPTHHPQTHTHPLMNAHTDTLSNRMKTKIFVMVMTSASGFDGSSHVRENVTACLIYEVSLLIYLILCGAFCVYILLLTTFVSWLVSA